MNQVNEETDPSHSTVVIPKDIQSDADLPGEPELCDRGDGVHGHYCIGRLMRRDEIYWEYWNNGVWCSAGEIFIGEHRAKVQLDLIRAYEALSRTTAIPVSVDRPRIICLCGSTRFMEAFQEANLRETLAGHIVLSVGTNTKSDAQLTRENYFNDPTIKERLDALHFRKIEMADEVLVLDVGGYMGESTRNEIEYATTLGKPIRYLSSTQDTESSEASNNNNQTEA